MLCAASFFVSEQLWQGRLGSEQNLFIGFLHVGCDIDEDDYVANDKDGI